MYSIRILSKYEGRGIIGGYNISIWAPMGDSQDKCLNDSKQLSILKISGCTIPSVAVEEGLFYLDEEGNGERITDCLVEKGFILSVKSDSRDNSPWVEPNKIEGREEDFDNVTFNYYDPDSNLAWNIRMRLWFDLNSFELIEGFPCWGDEFPTADGVWFIQSGPDLKVYSEESIVFSCSNPQTGRLSVLVKKD